MAASPTIHLWWGDTDGALHGDVARVVPADEIAAAAVQRQPRDRHRGLAVRYFLRRALGDHLGVDPIAIAFERSSAGKPRITSPRARDIQFSLSHSGAACLLAVAAGMPLGVDVEYLEPGFPWREMAEMYLSPAECRALRALPAEQQACSFLRRWVRCEAAAKLGGTGIDPRPGFLSGATGGEAPPFLRDIAAPSSYLAAVAARRKPARIIVHRGPASGAPPASPAFASGPAVTAGAR